MDRLINENAVLSAIGEWIAHNEHTYTNATEYLRNRIKAIKNAEQEPCEDCISRKAVLDALNKWDWQELYLPVHFKDMIDDLPSIQPKTGHWILQPSNKEQDERDFIWWKCSECGQVIYSETEQDRREYHAYCGRCGAKMLPTDSDCDSCDYQNEVDGSNCYECVKGIRDNYTAEKE